MKPRPLILALIISCAVFLSAEDKIARDYWPTKEWLISSPEEQEMSSAKLEEMSAYVEEELYPGASNITIIRHGYIVFEKNYFPVDSNFPRAVYSVTKSILSALIGIAVREKYIGNIDQKLIEFFPELKNATEDSEINTITLRHLLTLSDGLASNDMDDYFSSSIASRKLRNSPGKELFYNSLSPQILSIIITKTTGLKAFDFGKKHLFEPLGISKMRWEEAYGYSKGASGITLTTRDMAKIGYLYLNKGSWEGKQILPEEWVIESTRVEINVPDVPFFSTKLDYGFLWWIHSVGDYDAFSAIGWGGQYITVVPAVDLVVVITTQEYSHSNAPKYLSLIEKYVLPSVRH
jgi:CubicO group peptidase (beta-lactamase class C family)